MAIKTIKANELSPQLGKRTFVEGIKNEHATFQYAQTSIGLWSHLDAEPSNFNECICIGRNVVKMDHGNVLFDLFLCYHTSLSDALIVAGKLK